MIFNDMQNMGFDNSIERSVFEANIEMFKDSKSNPNLNIYYNLMDAFNFIRDGKRGAVTHTFSGTSLSGGLPSVIAVNQSNNNVLSQSIFNKAIKIFNIGYNVRMDENLVRDGKLSPESTIKKASELLNYQAINLMINGMITMDSSNILELNENSLYSCGIPSTGVNVGAAATTANQVNNMFLEMATGVEDAGFNPEVMLLSRKAFYKISNLQKNQGEMSVFEFLKTALNIDIYVTDFLDNIRGGGSTAIMTTRDEAGLRGVLGHEAFLVHDNFQLEGQTRKYILNVAVGGFAVMSDNKNIVQIKNKLLG